MLVMLLWEEPLKWQRMECNCCISLFFSIFCDNALFFRINSFVHFFPSYYLFAFVYLCDCDFL